MTSSKNHYNPFPEAVTRTLENRHGARVSYSVLGTGSQTLLLANGLGGRLYAWEPLVRAVLPEYRVITWDYRGLFDSTAPETRRHLSVPDHAEDAIAILDAEHIDRAVFCGWSMGVQVSLEATTLHPERVAGLVLINDTYGHVFSTGFQPVFRVPFARDLEHSLVEYVMDHPGAARFIERTAPWMVNPVAALFWLLTNADAKTMQRVLHRYTSEVFDEGTFANYLQLFQELDAHSVLHHLRRIEQPALVVSGTWDMLTPAYQSTAIAKRLPNAEHLRLRRASHFALMEQPDSVVPTVLEFLSERAQWK
jgi:3-oxoadipate enol-lactonase